MNSILEFLFNLDLDTVIWVYDTLQSPLWNPFWIFITTIGDVGAIWIILALALSFHPKTRTVGLTCLVALIFSGVITNLGLKNIVARARPFTYFDATLLIKEPHDFFSFPSGHTSASFAVAWVLFKDKFSIGKLSVYKATLVLAILMGLSRLYLSVHFPSDILAGVCTGILSGYLALKIKYHFLMKTTN